MDLFALESNRARLKQETLRIYGVCEGCRRCFSLCPSFNMLFDRVDAYESEIRRFEAEDHERIARACYYCKLCYNHCPYTPPHQYQIDFPRLMVAWKKRVALDRGVRWRDRLLIQTDLMGRLGSLMAPFVNWALSAGWLRRTIEHLVGIHRHRQILPFQSETFHRWWRRRSGEPQDAANGKVALFTGCLVRFQATDIGKATVQVLGKNRVEVALPGQQCCGMPSFDVGDTEAIKKAARANLASLRPWLEAGYDVVTPVPSCSLMFKREYPTLLPSGDILLLSERTFDICEYLMRLKRAGRLSLDFQRRPGRVAYQIPCHLRDQNIGFKSKELMETAGAQVTVIERCSGHDGSWGAKREFFDLSMAIAGKALRNIQEVSADLVATDCPLAALQFDQAGQWQAGGCPRTLHPVQIVRDAYGIRP